MTYNSPVFIHVEFESLPSDALQGAIPIQDLKFGDILLTIFPKNIPNPGVSTFFENVISADGEILQTSGSWGNSTPVMIAIFFRP